MYAISVSRAFRCQSFNRKKNNPGLPWLVTNFPNNSKTDHSGGWIFVLSGLNDLLERGEPPMPAPWALVDHQLRLEIICFWFFAMSSMVRWPTLSTRTRSRFRVTKDGRYTKCPNALAFGGLVGAPQGLSLRIPDQLSHYPLFHRIMRPRQEFFFNAFLIHVK